jgi:hypothetical protein
MISHFDVRELSAEKLLQEWRWLCPEDLQLVAINAFGDLFLENTQGAILQLDVAVGTLWPISDSLAIFKSLATDPGNQNAWFHSDLEARLERNGFRLCEKQCFGYKIPVVFKESATIVENVYVGDVNECVSFLGDLHKQLRDQADGAKVRINIRPAPKA